MSELRLVIFDVDGTLVDSQGLIVRSMEAAFDGVGLPSPSRNAIKGIVGLSLDRAVALLAPTASDNEAQRIVQTYKDAFFTYRSAEGAAASSPFFSGAREVLDQLRADPWTLLAVATGKSKRGLDALIEAHGLEGYFVSRQVADFHPSKPHPSMIFTAVDEAGVARSRTVMVGDTTYDMDMAKAAGVAAIGVSWGYHAVETLSADRIVGDFAELPAAINELLEARS